MGRCEGVRAIFCGRHCIGNGWRNAPEAATTTGGRGGRRFRRAAPLRLIDHQVPPSRAIVKYLINPRVNYQSDYQAGRGSKKNRRKAPSGTRTKKKTKKRVSRLATILNVGEGKRKREARIMVWPPMAAL